MESFFRKLACRNVVSAKEYYGYESGRRQYIHHRGLANYSIMGRWTAGLDASQTYTTAAVTSVSGEIKFTKFSETHAEGTFSFKARNTSQEEVSVTDGKFSVDF